MSINKTKFSYQELIDEIKSHHERGTSGTLLIFSDANMFVRMTMDEGNIILMACGDKQGMDVLPVLKKFNSCQLKFSSGQRMMGSKAPLPPMREILSELMVMDDGGEAPKNAAIPKEAIQSKQLSGVLNIVENELIDFLGPMGSIIWEETISDVKAPISVETLRTLINQAAEEIGDIEKMVLFKKQVNEKIKKM